MVYNNQNARTIISGRSDCPQAHRSRRSGSTPHILNARPRQNARDCERRAQAVEPQERSRRIIHALRVDAREGQGKTNDVVTQADTIDAFIELRDNLDRVGYAYYIAELVDRFSEEATENRALYDLFLNTLGWLGIASTNPDLLARFFELRLLQFVGYRPQLFECLHCGKTIEPIENFFSAEAGGLIDPDCIQAEHRARDAQPISLNALKVLRYLQTRDWETVRGLRLTPEAMAEVEALLQKYIVYHLERSLKSVDFLKDLKRSEG